MNTFLKAICIVIFATAVIGAFGVFHAGFRSIVQQVAVFSWRCMSSNYWSPSGASSVTLDR